MIFRFQRYPFRRLASDRMYTTNHQSLTANTIHVAHKVTRAVDFDFYMIEAEPGNLTGGSARERLTQRSDDSKSQCIWKMSQRFLTIDERQCESGRVFAVRVLSLAEVSYDLKIGARHH